MSVRNLLQNSAVSIVTLNEIAPEISRQAVPSKKLLNPPGHEPVSATEQFVQSKRRNNTPIRTSGLEGKFY